MSSTKTKSLKTIIRGNNKNTEPRNKQKTKVKQTNDSESIDSAETISENIKLNQLINPCKDVELYTRIVLLPHQINNDLYINLKKNLIDKIEGKCIKDGYIIKIYKIIEYKNGIIEPENFTGSVSYDIKYLAKICIALKESTIVAKITSNIINANIILAEFGPIMKIILAKNRRDFNEKKFIIGNDKSILHIPTQKKIGSNDFVKIQLKSIKFHHNDTVIKCMGYLEDLAYPEDITDFAYYEENSQNISKNNDMNTTIYFNEDNEQEDRNIEKSELSNLVETTKVDRNNKMYI